MSRTQTTITCRDCDYIPKVPNAGEVIGNCQIMHNGIKVYIGGYYGKWMTDIIHELKGHHEPQEEKVFFEILKRIKPGSTMIELGSFWAYYSMWFNKSIKNANSIMVEPSPNKLLLGKKHFKLNNMTGTFIHAAAGNCYKDSMAFKDWKGKIRDISQVSIDYLVSELKLEDIHIVHSDIQRAEVDMLRGCAKSFGKVHYFVISTHGDDNHRRCLKILENRKFNIIAQHKPSQSYSVDGLIAAGNPRKVEAFNIEISRR